MQSHETRIRVRYAETDQMGVVYYANYFIWMEIGRTEFCRAAGLRYKDLEQEEGIVLAVAEASCRYLYPARYDEEVVLETKLAQARPRVLRFEYELRSTESNRTLATGFTVHVFCGRDMRPCRVPEKYRPLFGMIEPET